MKPTAKKELTKLRKTYIAKLRELCENELVENLEWIKTTTTTAVTTTTTTTRATTKAIYKIWTKQKIFLKN